MVVFVDLEEDEEELQNLPDGVVGLRCHVQQQQLNLGDGPPKSSKTSSSESSAIDELSTLNINGFSAALSCYPVACSLGRHLDLNDLHALSRTCRQFRANLLPYVPQLIANSLRCVYDAQALITDLVASSRAANDNDTPLELVVPSASLTGDGLNAILAILPASSIFYRPDDLAAGINYPGVRVKSKIGACARDLVAECRRCGVVTCRNCAAKPPSDRVLKDRFRRLCEVCLKAPLDCHATWSRSCQTFDTTPPRSSASSSRSIRSLSSGSSGNSNTSTCDPDHPSFKHLPVSEPPFTQEAFTRGPCTCASRGVFLCAPCGQNLRSGDTTYRRVWTWRSRYSTHIGGLGTGMGEGDQGQKCGRGEGCLDPTGGSVAWVEIDCSDSGGSRETPQQQQQHQFLQHGQHQHDQPSSLSLFNTQRLAPTANSDESISPLGPFSFSTSSTSSSTPSIHTPGGRLPEESKPVGRPGYLRQEIEGIGGVVKKKVKKKVRVGATVCEYDDERETGRYLEREASGRARSWCGWCPRVVVGERDREGKVHERGLAS